VNGLPLPPPSPYATYDEPVSYYQLVWDTRGIPPVYEREGLTVITPQVGRLVIYGREVGSPYDDDQPDLEAMKRRGERVMGEWFSPVCREGELGTQDLSQCVPISAEEFSAAFLRRWEEEE
jgi:hypothetical protein